MAYVLEALVAPPGVLADLSRRTGRPLVALACGLELLPVTHDVRDALGTGGVRPFGDAFWCLSATTAAAAAEASVAGPVAYLEAELFGGFGTQAAVVWEGGEVALKPVLTAFEAVSEVGDRLTWAFNRALIRLGVPAPADPGDPDPFALAGLGRHRQTGEW